MLPRFDFCGSFNRVDLLREAIRIGLETLELEIGDEELEHQVDEELELEK